MDTNKVVTFVVGPRFANLHIATHQMTHHKVFCPLGHHSKFPLPSLSHRFLPSFKIGMLRALVFQTLRASVLKSLLNPAKAPAASYRLCGPG